MTAEQELREWIKWIRSCEEVPAVEMLADVIAVVLDELDQVRCECAVLRLELEARDT